MLKRFYIEITNRCNLRCSFCHFHHRPLQDMTIAEFTSILHQVKPYTRYIYLHVLGEPLLHPQFEEILSACDHSDMKVQLVTNGSLLDRYDDLTVHPSLRRLSISLQSLPFQADAARTLAQTERYIDIIRKKESVYLDIRFWRSDEVPAEVLKQLGGDGEAIRTSRLNSLKIAENVYISFGNAFVWPDEKLDEIAESGRCLGGIEQMAVLSDGTLVPCCLDAEGTINLGSLHETDLASLLKCERYMRLVKGFRSGKITESLCRRCQFRMRFDS
ncbi:MAG: radical SAM protein [Solobacterium sp.]|nr:radical SAM protein [Solobacterium sp.]